MNEVSEGTLALSKTCFVHVLCPIHTADADETQLSSLVASAVCTRIRN